MEGAATIDNPRGLIGEDQHPCGDGDDGFDHIGLVRDKGPGDCVAGDDWLVDVIVVVIPRLGHVKGLWGRGRGGEDEALLEVGADSRIAVGCGLKHSGGAGPCGGEVY